VYYNTCKEQVHKAKLQSKGDFRMMLTREVLQMKLDELYQQHGELLEMFETDKCSVDYLREQGAKILGEARGIAYAMGADVESDMGLEK
jgi:hypothetical protein